MGKEKFSFVVNVWESSSPPYAGDTYVDFMLTKKEKTLVLNAIEKGLEWEAVPELEDLYKRLQPATLKKILEDYDLTGEEVDPDDVNFNVLLKDANKYFGWFR